MPKRQSKKIIYKTQGKMAPPEPSYSGTTNPQYPNETEAQDEDLKSTLIKLIEALKKDMNTFL